MTTRIPDKMPNAENSSAFNIMTPSETHVGTTLENLKAAVMGETGASAKYLAYAKAAQEQGREDLARLFRATSAAEQIHIGLEARLVEKADPSYVRPVAEPVSTYTNDVNLIKAALGEIYETSDMYPAFIKKAQEENDVAAVQVFTRAKLAESVHAQRYLEAYNAIDLPDDGAKYYLCPLCGYIHRGDNFEKCPICFCPAAKFSAF